MSKAAVEMAVQLLLKVADEIDRQQYLMQQSGHGSRGEFSAGMVSGALRTIAMSEASVKKGNEPS